MAKRGFARLYLTDEDGNYYVQEAGMKQPVRVPDNYKSEVDAALEDDDERVGAFRMKEFDLSPVVRVNLNLTTLGACRGACGRDFAVLGDRGAARMFLRDDDGSFFVQAEGMKQPVRVPDEKRNEVEAIVSGKDDSAGFAALPPFEQRVSLELRTLGACRGTCGRTFGVLRDQTAS